MNAPATTSITRRFLVELLDRHGQPPDALLSAAGLRREELAAPDVGLPLPAFRELWARAAALEPAIGLTMVDRFPPGQMHILAHLALRCATVRDALDAICRYSHAAGEGDRFDVAVHGGCARVHASVAGRADNPWIAEHYLSMAVAYLAQATGRALPLRRVVFRAAPQAPLDAYRRRFALAPEFGADRDALEFDADALDWPLLSRDDYLRAILERAVTARRPPRPETPLDAVRRHLAGALLAGGTPSIDSVAAGCGCSVATLRTRLANEGTTFRQLLDEARRDLAREHLAGDMSTKEIAYLLGFSEPAAFQHACRRWFGCAVGEARRRLLTEGGA